MEWYQQQLTPPRVLEVNARLGIIPEGDHVQWLVEVKDPTTSVLIAQVSGPHRSMAGLHSAMEDLAKAMRRLVEETVAPF